MTTQQWLEKVRENGAILRQLVACWHPSARRPSNIQHEVPEAQMTITAPGAERACQVVREQVRREQPEDPLARWDKAVSGGDVSGIMSLLDEAWFGVPESRECWRIEGFKEAVDLLEDPPDFEGEPALTPEQIKANEEFEALLEDEQC